MYQRLNERYNGNCLEPIGDGIKAIEYEGLFPVVVTDPPFNIGYHYKGYKDRICDRG